MTEYDTGAYDADGVVSSGFAEVIQLMPLITPYTLNTWTDGTTSTATAYYAYAHNRVYHDAPGITGDDVTFAICWYIAYMMSGTTGLRAITSEKIGNSAWGYGATTDHEGYLAEYESVISKYLNNDIASVCATGVIHDDAEECSSDVIPYWGLSND
jgi:hypothetical protein